MTSKPQFVDESEYIKLSNDPNNTSVDAAERQLKELYLILNVNFASVTREEVYSSSEYEIFCDERKKTLQYVFFPWNNHIVRTVCSKDYYLLITNRNQDIITKEEQGILYNKHIAVFGMSVGSNVAFLLAQAGISRSMIIADFDQLDTTNLNRIFAGIHQVGLDKTDIVARKIFENNPYSDITSLDKGVSPEILENLLQNKQIDLIIEEVDDFGFKIQARSLAMKYKIPIIMVTDNGDGVVLHVERYDLNHDKIFGKPFDYWMQLLSGPKPTKEQVSKIIIEDIVGGENQVDPRMLESVKRVVSNELLSWPQLGSAAMLAGVVATFYTKQILLGRNSQKDIRKTIFIPKDNLPSHE